jgi:hypothetical protein
VAPRSGRHRSEPGRPRPSGPGRSRPARGTEPQRDRRAPSAA